MGMFSKLETHEFSVSGMTCGGCERKATNAVSALKGVKDVMASSAADKVVVVSKGVSKQEISAAITNVGFVVNH